MNNLQSQPADLQSPNSLDRDPRDSDEDLGDDSKLMAESEDEDSAIEFSEGSDEEDD